MIASPILRALSALHGGAWFTRAVTFGVRAVVRGERGVFLVRHTYRAGWYLPGGGVDRGETPEAAVLRELREEGGLVGVGRPRLHGLFRNGRRDYVACYVVQSVEVRERRPSLEIAEARWFAPDALPPDTTAATRARLAEVIGGREPPQDWV